MIPILREDVLNIKNVDTKWLAAGYRKERKECQGREIKLLRDYQEINYSILWGGRLARPLLGENKMSTPQEKFYVF
ncbi:hypothetical protein NIES4103_51180 [Nostoc sp. NIES-4103]|nr:hypothetical protein NIES4103_51180 [Nostoc sp. NIES-4103]